MVSVIKRKIRGKEYYSLQYSYRENGSVRNLYKEIGKEISKNLEEIKEEFIKEIVEKRWIQSIEQFKEKYQIKLKILRTI